jgi:2-polyprenyl-6-methoxyphenol hydroxylase-like FAD-dependent oxidoreductase
VAHVIVVGGGPAGASLAWLLADRGIEVTLLERQLDFSREFRGEVLLPTGIEALEQMGFGDVLAVYEQRPTPVALHQQHRHLPPHRLQPSRRIFARLEEGRTAHPPRRASGPY